LSSFLLPPHDTHLRWSRCGFASNQESLEVLQTARGPLRDLAISKKEPRVHHLYLDFKVLTELESEAIKHPCKASELGVAFLLPP